MLSKVNKLHFRRPVKFGKVIGDEVIMSHYKNVDDLTLEWDEIIMVGWKPIWLIWFTKQKKKKTGYNSKNVYPNGQTISHLLMPQVKKGTFDPCARKSSRKLHRGRKKRYSSCYDLLLLTWYCRLQKPIIAVTICCYNLLPSWTPLSDFGRYFT